MPKRQPGRNSKAIGREEANDGLRIFIETGSMAETARRMGRSRSSVYQVAGRDKWKQIVVDIEAERARQITKKVVEAEIKDLDLVSALMKKIYAELLAKNHIIGANPRDAVHVTRLKLEIEGELPGAPGEKPDQLAPIFQQIINVKDPETLEQLLDNAKVGIADRGALSRLDLADL